MRRFAVTMKRVTTHWLVVEVDARTPGEARQKAFRHGRDNPDAFCDSVTEPCESVRVDEKESTP